MATTKRKRNVGTPKVLKSDFVPTKEQIMILIEMSLKANIKRFPRTYIEGVIDIAQDELQRRVHGQTKKSQD